MVICAMNCVFACCVVRVLFDCLHGSVTNLAMLLVCVNFLISKSVSNCAPICDTVELIVDPATYALDLVLLTSFICDASIGLVPPTLLSTCTQSWHSVVDRFIRIMVQTVLEICTLAN